MRRAGAIACCCLVLFAAAPVNSQDLPVLPGTGSTAPDVGEGSGSPVDTTTFEVDDDAGTIGAELGREPHEPRPGPVETDRGPRCTYRPATVGELAQAQGGGEVQGVPDPNAQVTIGDGPDALSSWWRTCNGGQRQFVLQPANPDPIDLVPVATDRAIEQLRSPTLDVKPDPAGGGFVNLGTWFAIADPGTGDPPISCDGLGVPIEDVDPTLQTVDQGPCGYTYRASSPDDAPYQLAITAIYDIDWRTSDGRNGSLGTIRRTTTVADDIDEIQTVGGR